MEPGIIAVAPGIGPLDTAIIIGYLLAVVLLGVWLARRQNTLDDYLLAGRALPGIVILLSIVATETSTVTFLSIPGLAYDPRSGNLLFLQLCLGLVVGRLLVVVLFLPQYFRGKLFTAYQVLDQRFGGPTKQSASALFIVCRTLADGLRLYLTAIVAARLLGVSVTAAIVLLGVTTLLYTMLGGMRSVVWNDCVQFVIYIAGAVLAGWIIVSSLPGGWGQLADFARQHGKLRWLDFSIDPSRRYTFWSGLVGGCFLALVTHGTDQMMVQRYLSARSRKAAAAALAASGLVVTAQFALFLFLGIGLACFYHVFPPQMPFAKNDEVFAAFIVDHLPPGITGITLAAVLAAAMSTLSSSLNSSAAAAVNDFYKSWKRGPMDSARQLRVSRALTLFFGLVQMAVAIAGQHLQQSVVDNVLAIASFTSGAVLGVFLLGVLTRHVPQPAALIGLLGGLIVTAGVAFGTPVAWPWYALVGSCTTFAFGVAASQLMPSTAQ